MNFSWIGFLILGTVFGLLWQLITFLRRDRLVDKAIKLSEKHAVLKASTLQREFGIGYARASQILEKLKKMGIVGGGDMNVGRKVIKK